MMAHLTPLPNIRKVLIANRGEIAVRCIRACKDLGVRSVAIFTNADANSLHVSSADEAILLPGADGTAYTDGDEILRICKSNAIDAIVPGYGFLSENTDFATAAEKAGITFVGPSAASIKAMGLKHEAREIAEAAGVPIISGTSLLETATDAVENAKRIGFPVMLKATGGGGGMGLQICHDESEIEKAFNMVESRAGALFKNSGVFLERYFPRSRHIEVQIAGNGEEVVAFGERECSLQRRHQKVIEECPSPFVDRTPGLRNRLLQSAIRYAMQLNYKSVGTVEFLVDDETADHFFLEMNTRLQVEHGITEMCYGVDLVHLMLRQADFEKGGSLGIPSSELRELGRSEPLGFAVEARLYAEAPLQDFSPSPGFLQHVAWPKGDGVRVDTWVTSGQKISPYYDPLVGKLMVYSQTGRSAARDTMLDALRNTALQGTETNLEYVERIIESDMFKYGDTLTTSLSTFKFFTCAIEILDPGVLTTVQDYPGRPGVSHGIPRSGPMDDVSSRIANLLVGNDIGVELLELTLNGPEIFFHTSAIIAICGAKIAVAIDGENQPMWSRLVIEQGQKLKIGNVLKNGFRSYLAIKGGFPQIPKFLGSKSTVAELGFGGHQGRKLQTHDILRLAPESASWACAAEPFSLPDQSLPDFEVRVVNCLNGPYGDMLSPEGFKTLYETFWTVSNNTGRSGVRLSGPQLAWARTSGGGGGSHPSNVYDYGYPFGGLCMTGDSPVILPADGPDLGGFACPVTVCSADFWKIGQLKPGDNFKFKSTTFGDAQKLVRHKEDYIKGIRDYIEEHSRTLPTLALPSSTVSTEGILQVRDGTIDRPQVTYRQGGDTSIIIEYGNQKSDLNNTKFVRLLSERLAARSLDGVLPMPNIATLTVHYDPLRLDQQSLLDLLVELDHIESNPSDAKINVREVNLPVCLKHPAIQEAVDRYMQSIRPSAAFLPDNIEYIQQCNALSSRNAVFDALLNTSWLTIAVGFYVGTPIMFPLDPRYEYIGQKYNPSRLYTPGGAVGLGGSLLAVYPITAPGGYQLIGRTFEVWDSSGTRPGFSPSRPWLFDHFDVIKFFEVTEEEYDRLAQESLTGRYTFDIRPSTLDIDSFIAKFAAANADPEFQDWKRRQQIAQEKYGELEKKMAAEWTQATAEATAKGVVRDEELLHLPDAVVIEASMGASVWKVLVKEGDVLEAGQVLVVLEAMKMEINVVCSSLQAGAVVKRILTPPGTIVNPGVAMVVAMPQSS